MNGRAALSLFCLAPREVCRAVRLPGFAVGSYSTISPLPVTLRPIGGIFLLHCLSGFLALPVPHFHEARCPVVSGLSSTLPCGNIATVRGAARGTCGLRFCFPIKISNGDVRSGALSKDRLGTRIDDVFGEGAKNHLRGRRCSPENCLFYGDGAIRMKSFCPPPGGRVDAGSRIEVSLAGQLAALKTPASDQDARSDERRTW